MKTILKIAVVGLALGVSACETVDDTTVRRGATGAAVGAVTGGIIGSLTGDFGKGAVAGAALGAGTSVLYDQLQR